MQLPGVVTAVAVLLLVPAAALAQGGALDIHIHDSGHLSTGPRDRPRETSGTGRISGRVLDGATGQPIRGAVVRLATEHSGTQQTTGTDENGRYEFTELPAGHFGVMVSKGAYVPAGGRGGLPNAGEHFELARGQHKAGVDVRLVRGAVLAGRLTDAFGEPAAGIRVTALKQMTLNGRKRLMPFGPGDLTDDLGRFRLFGLPTGEYYVSTDADRGVGGFWHEDNGVGLLRTYYPGTPSISEAETVRVRAGEELASLTFALAPSRAVKVSGTVFDSAGRPLAGGFLMLESMSILGVGGGAEVGEDGRFRVENLSPGDYVMLINPGAEGGESAAEPFTVGLEDISGLTIVTSPPTVVTGQVLFETAPPESVTPEQLSFQIAPTDGSLFGGSMIAVAEDWTFETRLHADRVVIQPGGLPPGWGLKAVLAGGVDVTRDGLPIRGRPRVDGFQLVLSAQMASLSGRVTDAHRRPVSRGVVVMFVDDGDAWAGPSRRMLSTPVSQDGAFTVRHVPPGDYLAVAVPDFDLERIGDTDYQDALRGRATAVTIRDGERRTVNLELTDVE